MDNGGDGLRDCLGDYFQEYISGGHIGQFFTPQNICELMASLTIFDRWIILKIIYGICTIAKATFINDEIPEIKPLQIEKHTTDSTQLLLDFVA